MTKLHKNKKRTEAAGRSLQDKTGGSYDFAMIKRCIEHLICEHSFQRHRLTNPDGATDPELQAKFEQLRRSSGVDLTSAAGLTNAVTICNARDQIAPVQLERTIRNSDYTIERLEEVLSDISEAATIAELSKENPDARLVRRASDVLCWPPEEVNMVGGVFLPFDQRSLPYVVPGSVKLLDEKRYMKLLRRNIGHADVILAKDRLSNRVGLIYGDDGFQKILRGKQHEAGRLLYISIDEQQHELTRLIALTLEVKGSVSQQVLAAMKSNKV